MRRYRAVVGVLLAAIATFLVSCGSKPAAVAPTYTPEKIAQLQTYVERIAVARERLPELAGYIEKDNWVNVDNFTHGPLGQLRAELARLSNQLLPADQSKAKQLSEDILSHLQNIDVASQNRNYSEATAQLREFTDDLDALLNNVVPEGARPQPKAAPPSKAARRRAAAAEPRARITREEPQEPAPQLDESLEEAADSLRSKIEDLVPDFDKSADATEENVKALRAKAQDLTGDNLTDFDAAARLSDEGDSLRSKIENLIPDFDQ
jgi:photosystem II protein PsbQ